MTQYNMLSVKLSNSQLSLKSGIKHGTEVTLNLSSNLTWNSNDATNFSHKLSLTHTQVQRFITIHNGSSAKTKFSKTQLSKMIQSGGSIFYMPSSNKVLSEIVNTAEDLSNKVTLNEVIKAVCVSKM